MMSTKGRVSYWRQSAEVARGSGSRPTHEEWGYMYMESAYEDMTVENWRTFRQEIVAPHSELQYTIIV